MVLNYVYELYDKDDKLFYVGSSFNPKQRMNDHMVTHGSTTKMKIVSKTPHIEINLINEYVSKGIVLKNKETARNPDSILSVGDWIVNPKFKSSNYEYRQPEKETN